VDDEIHALDRILTASSIANVAFNQPETISGRNLASNLIQIPLVASGEIVEADHSLPVAQKRFDDVRADESGRASDKPGRLG